MHDHNDCDHDLKYCGKCDVVWCRKCKKEWNTHSPYYPYWYNTYPCGGTGIITYTGNTTVACNHE